MKKRLNTIRNPVLLFLLLALACTYASASQNHTVVRNEGNVVFKDFHFKSGEALPELRLHYLTFGTPVRDKQGIVRNAVLILHATGGSASQFLRPEFAGELFRPGGELDASRFFIIIPDNIGHGQSSKPSDGLRGKFPRYGYHDMVEVQYRLLTEVLKVNHLRLVLGTSMGGMHTWLWGERYPDFMDALMPLASLPVEISGRNRIWRRIIIDAIRNDPEWQGGDYKNQPQGLRIAQEMLYFMGSNPLRRQQQMPSMKKTDAILDAAIATAMQHTDANDFLYQFEASYDYNPGPDLEQISASLLAVNFADDLINPHQLGILQHEIKRVPNGRAVVMPFSDKTDGHGTHTLAAVWKHYLGQLLEVPAR